eukprot:gene19663-26350_t
MITCAKCCAEVTGKYTIVDNNAYHNTCVTCDHCKKPLLLGNASSHNVHDGKKYHQTCFREAIAERCAMCNVHLLDTYYVTPYWKPKLCETHSASHKECNSCSWRVQPGESYAVWNDIVACKRCSPNAVYDDATVNAIYDGVVDPDEKKPRPRVTLVPTYGEGSTTLAETTFDSNGRATKMTAQGGLSRMAFAAIMAHEHNHVVMRARKTQPNTLQEEEGQCELHACAYLLCQTKAEEAMAIMHRILHNPVNMYREGLRDALCSECKNPTVISSDLTQILLDLV